MAKSSCPCNKRISSNNASNCSNCCFDICTNPQCGDPHFLSLLAPVVYDEIGINLCQTVPVANLLTNYPTAEYASAEAISLNFTSQTTASSIVQIPSRPNCYEINLTNLSFTIKLNLFDCCKRLLGSIPLSNVIYLPSDTTSAGYDEETNPSNVTLDLFAPYGVSYTGGVLTTPYINFIGFSSESNSPAQGLNAQAIFKVLDFNLANEAITLGLTLTINSMYYNEYQIPHNGKTIISKGKIISSEDSVCMDFVTGSLLDRDIKPLELFNVKDSKEDCSKPDITPCMCDLDVTTTV
ncbi:MAG: hypothetical protein PUG10_02570 [Lachnospiraceae bacterium]|nr:hypothetical protein [Lachnospiraceae bacterium]